MRKYLLFLICISGCTNSGTQVEDGGWDVAVQTDASDGSIPDTDIDTGLADASVDADIPETCESEASCNYGKLEPFYRTNFCPSQACSGGLVTACVNTEEDPTDLVNTSFSGNTTDFRCMSSMETTMCLVSNRECGSAEWCCVADVLGTLTLENDYPELCSLSQVEQVNGVGCFFF